MPDFITQEIIIDIHIRKLKFTLIQDNETQKPENVPISIMWSRGKKNAKTKKQDLITGKDVTFDEKFQINTILELDPQTLLPIKEKMSKLTVILEQEANEIPYASVEFNMTDFKYGRYNGQKLFFSEISKAERNNQNCNIQFDLENSYLEIGIKGTKAEGLVQDRMKEIKNKKEETSNPDLQDSPKNQEIKASENGFESPTKVQMQQVENFEISPDQKVKQLNEVLQIQEKNQKLLAQLQKNYDEELEQYKQERTEENIAGEKKNIQQLQTIEELKQEIVNLNNQTKIWEEKLQFAQKQPEEILKKWEIKLQEAIITKQKQEEADCLKIEKQIKEKDVLIEKIQKQITQLQEAKKKEQKFTPSLDFDRFTVTSAPFYLNKK